MMEQKTSTERADVDNLAAAVLDALEKHVLPEPAGDGAVMELLVSKREARGGEESGALITVIDLASWHDMVHRGMA